MAILTSIESDQTEFLKSKGLFVKAISKLSLCSCVIDKAITWYGSINILGYAAEEDNIIKIEDFKLANELLNVIYDSKDDLDAIPYIGTIVKNIKGTIWYQILYKSYH